MRQTFALCLSAATLATAGHVSVSVSRERFSHPRAKFFKRQDSDDDDGDTFTLEALNNITGGGYYSEFGIGSPPQMINFQLDTGSSDTWVNSVDADYCSSTSLQMTGGFCETQFDQEESDTYETVDRNGFQISYLDGRVIEGDYFEDTVTFGDLTIENQQLGLALSSSRPSGIMGLGLSSNLASRSPYSTIVENMVENGYIETLAFSLYLNDIETDAGNILFGGIDTRKFIGELAILPLVVDESLGSSTDQITSFNVRLDGFDVLDPDGERTIDLEDLNSFAILDSGSTISLLPDDQVQDIWDEFGVVTFSGLLTPLIDCAYAGDLGNDYFFEFRFDGKTIQVPMDEMVIDAFADVQDELLSDRTLRAYFEDWEGVCMFGMGSTGDFGFSGDDFTLLGATFLRSAYVVYDLANEQIAIAQANQNTDEEDIVEITSGALPDVTGVDSQSPTSSSTSTSTSTSTRTSNTSTSTPSDNDEDEEEETTSSTEAPPSETETETGADNAAGPTNTADGDDDDNASGRLSAPMASLIAFFGLAFVLV